MRKPFLALAALLAAPCHAADEPCLTCARQSGGFYLGGYAVALDDGLPPYSAWDQDGGVLVMGASAGWEQDARFRTLTFDYLSGDEYRFDAGVGALGGWRAGIHYDRFAVRRSDGALTPYHGLGSDDLTLPAGWVTAATTGGMAALPGALDDVEIGLERGHLAIALAFPVGRKWHYDVRFAQRTTEGRTAVGGLIGTAFVNGQTAILPVPVDHRTSDYQVAAHYTAPVYHLRVTYEGSLFENAYRAVTWDNAFDTAASVPQGRMALAPDNQFHQLSLSGGYDISSRSRANFRLAYGRMQQDEPLLPYTVNASIGATALPADSAQARIDTWNADAKWLHEIGTRDSVDVSFKHDELENLTPQEVWAYVTGDTAAAANARINLPYSFRRQRLAANWLHRLDDGRLNGGIAYQREERAYREAADLRENSAWAEWVRSLGETGQLTLHAVRSDRDGDYEQLTAITPQENPLLRKFTLAARIGNRLRARFDRAVDGWDLGVEGSVADYDYPDSDLGLTSTVERSLSADAAFRVTASTSVTAFIGTQRYSFVQAGSAAYAAPDWQARGDDDVLSLGLGVHYAPGASRWSASCDASYTRSRGEYRVAGSDYPTLEGDLARIAAEVGYRLSARSRLELRGAIEQYDERDWATADVAPDTITNVLSLGEGESDYRAIAVGLAWYRKF